ncbi:fasciclin domain-containing protein [Planosporangium mesophilum]|nr:fasciclin domain-containing protein [Planosporangium mesophilum]NJC82983.1 fasciclin domain-containing protein [Planosporangium mesophilum]
MIKSRIASLVAVGAAGVFALSACGSNGGNTSSSPQNTTPAAPAPAPTTQAAMTGDTFGAGCAAVPTDASNPGSFTAMAKVPVATAASGNPVLKTLVTAVTKAELGDTLNSAKDITVFAPTDDAFAKIPADSMNAVLADQNKLKSVLTYHVVAGRLTPAQLAGTHKTLQGGEITVAGSGTSYTVNGSSKVVCGNVQTANATVYIVDTVLMPAS